MIYNTEKGSLALFFLFFVSSFVPLLLKVPFIYGGIITPSLFAMSIVFLSKYFEERTNKNQIRREYQMMLINAVYIPLFDAFKDVSNLLKEGSELHVDDIKNLQNKAIWRMIPNYYVNLFKSVDSEIVEYTKKHRELIHPLDEAFSESFREFKTEEREGGPFPASIELLPRIIRDDKEGFMHACFLNRQEMERNHTFRFWSNNYKMTGAQLKRICNTVYSSFRKSKEFNELKNSSVELEKQIDDIIIKLTKSIKEPWNV